MVVPVIDIAGLHGADRETIKTQFLDAIDQVGFFQILNHGIPVDLLERVKEVVTDNFNNDREPKFRESVPYQVLQKTIESEEVEEHKTETAAPAEKKIKDLDWEDVFALQYEDPTYEWPSQPSNFRETLKEFGAAVRALAEELLELLDEALGLEKGYLRKALGGDAAYFGTKVSHYPPCPCPGNGNDLIWGLRAHTDAGGLILLFQDEQVAGLQCKSKEGQWVDVQPLKHSIVLNMGDQLEAISNGRLRSAWHRIYATPNSTRMSVASYYNPNLQTLVQPAPSLLAHDAHAATAAQAYPPYVFRDYINVYAKQKFLAKEPRFPAAAASN